MNSPHAHIAFDNVASNGVHQVDAAHLAELAARAAHAGAKTFRIPLDHCRDKTTLLLQVAHGLHLPASAADNWDALADCLRDEVRIPGKRIALMLVGASALRHAAPGDFATLVSVLEAAAAFNARQRRVFVAAIEVD